MKELRASQGGLLHGGAGGQTTFVVSSHDLVIVRRGHFRGDGEEMNRGLNEALRGILEAVEPVSP